MSETNFFRLIEQYFDGTISSSDKILLELKLERDPLLKAEFELQQDIQTGIAEHRKNELKSRLSQIDLPANAPFVQLTNAQYIITAVVSALTLSAIFFYPFNQDNVQIKKLDIVSNNQSLAFTDNLLPLIPSVADNEYKPQNVNKSTSTKPEQEKSTKKTEDSAQQQYADQSAEKVISETEKTAKVEPQSVLSYEDDHIFNSKEPDAINTIKGISPRTSTTKSTTVEIIEDNSRKRFHYKYSNNKLYLFGNFKNIPYQIIELNNKGKKQLFLFHDDNFYIIKNNTLIVSPLAELKDKQLIEELRLIASEDLQ